MDSQNRHRPMGLGSRGFVGTEATVPTYLYPGRVERPPTSALPPIHPRSLRNQDGTFLSCVLWEKRDNPMVTVSSSFLLCGVHECLQWYILSAMGGRGEKTLGKSHFPLRTLSSICQHGTLCNGQIKICLFSLVHSFIYSLTHPFPVNGRHDSIRPGWRQ